MNIKNISILTAVLAGIAGVLWIAQRSSNPSLKSDLVGQGLLNAEAIGDAQSIQIFETAEDSPAVEIVKQGDNWIVPKHYGLPVDFQKVSDMISGLAESTIIRAVTDNPDRIQMLDLGQTRIVFTDASGDSLADISFGKSGNTGGTFAKIERSEKVVLASDKPFIQTSADNWAVSKAWELKWDDVRSIVQKGESTGIQLTREDAESDFTSKGLEDEVELEQSEIRTSFTRFTNLRFQDLAKVGSEEVAEALEHAKTWDMQTEAGDTFTFTYGRRPEVKAPEPEATEEGGEEETGEKIEDIPAGTPYLIVKHNKANELWSGIYETYAFELTSFNFEQLPESIEAFIVEPKPEEVSEETESEG